MQEGCSARESLRQYGRGDRGGGPREKGGLLGEQRRLYLGTVLYPSVGKGLVAFWEGGLVGGLGGKKEKNGDVLAIKMSFRDGEQSPGHSLVDLSVCLFSQLIDWEASVCGPLICRMTTFLSM